ncbi:galactose oxidase [Setomelanomma holmii]|uniref:Galactose oxidase n=1 Tax=Setomelanomma holmii TaxID=210430 RepID=A0A9P4H5S2_9PLEO|nr:galactose oxidase [Setomelanomma holmii]
MRSICSKVLVFSSWADRAFFGPTASCHEITQFADCNLVTPAVSQRTVTETKHDMFCPGMSFLSDGRIVITGGENAETVSIYSPITNAFTRAADMKIPRGYQTSATLSDGRSLTIGGSLTGGLYGKTGEVFDSTRNIWTLLQGTDPKPLLTTDREGIVGPSKAMHWYYTDNGGSVVSASTRTNEMDQMYYTDSAATTATHLISITDPGKPATVEKMPNMAWARGFANAVVLLNDQVIVSGGQARSAVFADLESVLIPELFDPVRKTWMQLASAAVPHNYHSVSLLLPDGTVFVGGGGMYQFVGEIFSPPYLFTSSGAAATRPVISAVSASKVIVGATITVTLAGNLQNASFVPVRMGTATHNINSDQRRVPLANIQSNGAGKYTIRLPNDSDVVIPGPWYLFALDKEWVREQSM